MNRPDEIDYYSRREEASREMAQSARDATARRSHEELARRYHAMVERLVPPQPFA